MTLSLANPATDGNGVQSWDVTSAYNGPATTVLRVLAPTAPEAGQPHCHCYVLPVKPGLDATFGDGLEVLRTRGLHNRYNCTLIAPSFALEPWIGDHPSTVTRRYESFLVLDLYPWAEATLVAAAGRWLCSFSKGGLGAWTLLLRHPDLWDAAAAWDVPVQTGLHELEPYDGTAFGTQETYETFYDLPVLLAGFAGATPSLTTRKRLWLGRGNAFSGEVDTFSTQLSAAGILYWGTALDYDAHHWLGTVGGTYWIEDALRALYTMHLWEHYDAGGDAAPGDSPTHLALGGRRSSLSLD